MSRFGHRACRWRIAAMGRFGVRIWALPVAMFILSGCASDAWAPPSATLRQQLGAIAIVSTSYQTPLKAPPRRPVSGAGEGAREGLRQGFGGALAGSLTSGPGGAGLIFLSPVIGAVGAVAGAAASRSAEDVDEADARLRDFVYSEQPDQELARHILAAAMKQVPERKLEFVGIDDIDLGDSPAAAARNRSRYAQLGATGYDSVLHVSMVYWFDVDGTISPSVTLRATIDATLFLTGSNTEAYRRSWHYFSEPKNYFDLAADDARRLRQEFQDAYTGIAEKVVNDIFVAEMPEDEANTNTGRVRTIQVGEPAP